MRRAVVLALLLTPGLAAGCRLLVSPETQAEVERARALREQEAARVEEARGAVEDLREDPRRGEAPQAWAEDVERATAALATALEDLAAAQELEVEARQAQVEEAGRSLGGMLRQAAGVLVAALGVPLAGGAARRA